MCIVGHWLLCSMCVCWCLYQLFPGLFQSDCDGMTYQLIQTWFRILYYNMCTLYWCMHSIMCCNCCDRVATPSLTNATNGLWSVMFTSLGKAVVMELLQYQPSIPLSLIFPLVWHCGWLGSCFCVSECHQWLL